MKILFFSYAYPNLVNPGLGTFNRTMIEGLTGEHEVRVVSPVAFTDVWNAWSKGRLPRGLNDPTFQVVPGVPAEYCSWYYTPKLFRSRYGHFMMRSVATSLKKVMTEFQPDVVLSYWTHPDGEVAVKTAHEFGTCAIAMVGGSDVLINGRHGARRQATLNVLKEADGVITVSDNIKQVLLADGIANEKLYVARRGTDRRVFHGGDRKTARQRLGLTSDRPILISVGRLVDVKGHVHLIEACRLMSQRQISFKCYLLGDGPLRASLQSLIDRHGLGDFIELRGSQTPLQLAEWYRAADLSVLASLSEGVPNVLLESIACGTPFVASNVGGIPEIADPTLDTLVPAGSPDALATAITEHLATIHQEICQSRRFEPPTMSGSAESLGCILQSVRTGRRSLLSGNSIMHETMTETDVTKKCSTPELIESSCCAQTIDKRMIDASCEENEEILGRTGENFKLSSPAAVNAACDAYEASGRFEAIAEEEQAEKGSNSGRETSIATVPYQVGPEDDDHVGRTGEGFYYRP